MLIFARGLNGTSSDRSLSDEVVQTSLTSHTAPQAMPNVSFDHLQVNHSYSRTELARIWGYKGYEAIARGVVAPAGHSCIILFVTREKQASATQYQDRLEGNRLYWEGPADHFAEDRINRVGGAGTSQDDLHLFYRDRHHSDFVYYGPLELESANINPDLPSHFVFRVVSL